MRPSVLFTLLCACAPTPGGPVDPIEDEPASPEAAGLEVPAAVRRNLGITFAEVEARPIVRTLRLPGAFELRPRARREYRMELAGRVELLVDQHQAVAAGQPLFRFQSPAWPELLHEIVEGEQAIATAGAEIRVAAAALEEARAAHRSARARLDALADAAVRRADLEAEAERAAAAVARSEAEGGLAETRLVNARKTHEHALHRAATAAGISEADLAREVERDGERVPAYRTIDWIEVRAAEDGVVEGLAVTDGAFVEPTGLVLATVDPGRVRLRAVGLQADLALLAEVREARIVPPGGFGGPPDDGVAARVTLGLEAHPEERSLIVYATPSEAAPWIRAGVSAFLEVRVEGDARPVLALPRGSVVRDGLQHVFFRRAPGDPDRVLRVEADLGRTDGRWVEVRSGVMRGDAVVLDGAYELMLEGQRPAGGAGGGHVHADETVHGEH